MATPRLCILFYALSFCLSALAAEPGTLIGWGELPWTLAQHRNLTNITSLASKAAFGGIALRADGTVRITGDHGDSRWVPPEVTNVVSVAAGGHLQFLALRGDGRVIAWESIWGIENPPPNLTNVVLIASASPGGAVVLEDGEVITWELRYPIPPYRDAIAIAAGTRHFVMIRSNGTVVAWGDNSVGQTNVPPGLSNVVAIAANQNHNLALRGDGTVVAWGQNDHGQAAVPPGLSNVVSIAAGGIHSLALRSDGSIVAWGGNEYGQLNVPAGYNDLKAIHATPIGSFGITQLPVFLGQPQSGTVEAGSVAMFVAEAIASSEVTFQWFHNDEPIGGATNSSVTIDNPQDSDAGTYVLRASTAAGSIDSAAASLTVNPAPPRLVTLTPSLSVVEGSSTNLEVGARGSEPFQFSWTLNGEPLTGETNALLSLTNIGAEHSGNYEVVVSNLLGSVASGPVTLNVNFLPRILNSLTNVTVDAGSSLTLEANATGTQPLAYRWFQEGKLLSTSGSVRVQNVQAPNAAPIWLVVSNAFGIASNIVATLTIQPRAPVITRQPADQFLQTNSPVFFSVAVAGSEPMIFQWFKNDAALASATNRALVLPTPTSGDLAEYSVHIANSVGQATSAVARLLDLPVTNAVTEWPTLELERVVSGLTQLTGISHAGDGSGRLFLLEQAGRIRVVESGMLLPTPFLELTDRVLSGGERGLLGIAFAPGFAESGEFYVNYTRRPDGATIVSRFTAAPGSNVADTNEVVLLTVPQPASNHNGGQLAFGPDGYLYVATGDGGGGNDFFNNGQNTNSLLGKILRIDVSGSSTNYNIPPTNPFVGREGYRPEIWALGLRNPWRFSFDRVTGDLFIADVGEMSREEVNYQPRTSAGGENYGWPIFEATLRTQKPGTNLNTNEFIFPVTEYSRQFGASITGGYIGRNPDQERMWGVYFFADYVSGRLWGLRRSGNPTSETNRWETIQFGPQLSRPTTFGEDEAGNIYVAMSTSPINSQVMRLVDTREAFPPTFSPRPGFYSEPQTVTITSDPGTRIHYRLDGGVPTESDPFILSGQSLQVMSNQFIAARAYRADLEPSTVITATYTLLVPISFSPTNRLVTNGTLLTITSPFPDVTIRYTLDGTEVTETSPVYTNAIPLSGHQTLRAVGYKPGWNPGIPVNHFFGLLRPVKFALRPFAGSGVRGFTNGPAAIAAFNEPQGLAFDPEGNLFVADSRNGAVRKIDTNGMVTTLLGPDLLVAPVGLTFDASGNLYVGDADGYRILKVTPTGDLSTVAGNGERGLNDGTFESARVAASSYLELLDDGTIYFSDFAMVRKVSTDGQVISMADDGGNNVFRLSTYNGLALSPAGELFAASGRGRIFKIGGTEPLEHFAGAGPVIGELIFPSDGPRLSALFYDDYYFNRPIGRDMLFDAAGNLLVGDQNRLRRISPDGQVSTLVFSLDDPVHDQSPFQLVTGLAFDARGTLHVADIRTHRIWKIAPDTDLDEILDTEEGGGTVFVLGEDDRLRDSDGDGISNSAEYLAGTDPAAADLANQLAVEIREGSLILKWSVPTGKTGRLERSADLQKWTDIGTIDGTPVSTVIAGERAFFRIVSQ